MHPLALPDACWQKLLQEQVLCADLITKEVKRWQVWQNEPFSVEWLLEEWWKMSWKEALLRFYFSSVKGKLYIQGTYTAMLFFTFNLTLLFIRDGEEVLFAVQLKGDLLSRESVWLGFRSVWCLRLSMQVQNPMLGLKTTLSRHLKAHTQSEGIFYRNSYWLPPIFYKLFLQRVSLADKFLEFADKSLVHTNSC